MDATKLSYAEVAKAYDATFAPLVDLKLRIAATRDPSPRGATIKRAFVADVDADILSSHRTFWASTGWTEHEFWTECHRRIRSGLVGMRG